MKTDIERLRRFRVMRRRYLRKGRRTFRGAEWKLYLAELDAVKFWISGLHDPMYDVAYYYWIRVLPDFAIAQRIFYSERQVRRIRRRIIAAL